MASTIDQNTNDFLEHHSLSPSDFSGDKRSELVYQSAYDEKKKGLAALARQNRAMYGKNPMLEQQQRHQAEVAKREFEDKARLLSIQETMKTYQDNPRSFDARLKASRDAEYALNERNYDKAGIGAGAITGGVVGHGLASIGARMKKVNPKFFGPIGGLAGIAGGAMLGHQLGRKANEQVTGRMYSEVQTPYEIADRLRREGS